MGDCMVGYMAWSITQKFDSCKMLCFVAYWLIYFLFYFQPSGINNPATWSPPMIGAQLHCYSSTVPWENTQWLCPHLTTLWLWFSHFCDYVRCKSFSPWSVTLDWLLMIKGMDVPSISCIIPLKEIQYSMEIIKIPK